MCGCIATPSVRASSPHGHRNGSGAEQWADWTVARPCHWLLAHGAPVLQPASSARNPDASLLHCRSSARSAHDNDAGARRDSAAHVEFAGSAGRRPERWRAVPPPNSGYRSSIAPDRSASRSAPGGGIGHTQTAEHRPSHVQCDEVLDDPAVRGDTGYRPVRKCGSGRSPGFDRQIKLSPGLRRLHRRCQLYPQPSNGITPALKDAQTSATRAVRERGFVQHTACCASSFGLRPNLRRALSAK